jgi:hypothetical protein
MSALTWTSLELRAYSRIRIMCVELKFLVENIRTCLRTHDRRCLLTLRAFLTFVFAHIDRACDRYMEIIPKREHLQEMLQAALCHVSSVSQNIRRALLLAEDILDESAMLAHKFFGLRLRFVHDRKSDPSNGRAFVPPTPVAAAAAAAAATATATAPTPAREAATPPAAAAAMSTTRTPKVREWAAGVDPLQFTNEHALLEYYLALEFCALT